MTPEDLKRLEAIQFGRGDASSAATVSRRLAEETERLSRSGAGPLTAQVQTADPPAGG